MKVRKSTDALPEKRHPFSLRIRFQDNENAAKQKSRGQNWRDKLKDTNSKKYNDVKEMAKKYSQFYRLNMSLAEGKLKKRKLSSEDRQDAEMWLERKKVYNEKSKLRQRKYAAKKKLQQEKAKEKKHATPLTRQKADKKKEYERQKKRKQRAAYSREKRQAVNARRRQLYAKNKENEQNIILEAKRDALRKEEKRLREIEDKLRAREEDLSQKREELEANTQKLKERNKELTEHSPSNALDMRSGTSRRQSLHRARSGFPCNVSHYAGTVVDLIQKASPRKSIALKNAGVNLQTCTGQMTLEEGVMKGLQKELKESKPKQKKVLASPLAILKKYKLQSKACKYFNISRKLLETSKKRQGKQKLNLNTVRKVQQFYELHSTQLPDKKLVSKKTGKPRFVMDRTIGTLHQEYNATYPNEQVSASTFYSLRPKHVQTKQQAKYYGCLCEYCENIQLKLPVLSGHSCNSSLEHFKSVYALSNSTLCPKASDAAFHQPCCLQRKCADCGVNRLDTIIKGDVNQIVEWKRWELTETMYHTKTKQIKPVKKRTIVAKQGTLAKLIQELKIEAQSISLHLFRKDWQHQQMKALRSKLPENALLSIVDFSENYKCSYQREVQSAYYSQNSATLHPIVNYYRCHTCKREVKESCIMISDDLCHDHHLVRAFQLEVCKHLKETRHLNISKIYRWSDGCSSQYKSKGPFSDISRACQDLGCPLQQNFFGTRHGKGASDGEGAVVKSQASTAVLAGTYIINNAKALFEFSKKYLTKDVNQGKCCEDFLRTSLFVPVEVVDRENERHTKTVKGTRQLHSVKTVKDGVIATRNLTCVCDPCLDGLGACENTLYVNMWREVNLHDGKKKAVTSKPDNYEEDNKPEDGYDDYQYQGEAGIENLDKNSVDGQDNEDAADSMHAVADIEETPKDVETPLQPPGADAADFDTESAVDVQIHDFVAVRVKCTGKTKKDQLHVAKVARVLENGYYSLSYMVVTSRDLYTWPQGEECFFIHPECDIICKLPEPECVTVGSRFLSKINLTKAIKMFNS